MPTPDSTSCPSDRMTMGAIFSCAKPKDHDGEHVFYDDKFTVTWEGE